MSVVAYLMEGPTVGMDYLWVIHSMSQPNSQVNPLYGTLNLTGLIHPTIQVTPNGTGHTLRVESTRLMGWGIQSSGSLHEYGQFPWSLLTPLDLTM